MARREGHARGGGAVRAAVAVALVLTGCGLVGWSVSRDRSEPDPGAVSAPDVVDPDPDPTPTGSLDPVTIRTRRPARAMAAPTHVPVSYTHLTLPTN